MSQTLDYAGHPLFFPATLATDDMGVIQPRPADELAAFASRIASDQLLPFMRRLVNGTSKRKRQAKWEAVNRQRMELLRLCTERVLTEGILGAVV